MSMKPGPRRITIVGMKKYKLARINNRTRRQLLVESLQPPIMFLITPVIPPP